MITQDSLKEALSYCPRTGIFTRVVGAGNVKKGSIAGGDDGNGYVKIRLYGRRYRAHRLAWLYVHGKFPEGEIDHINGIRDDNRIENLRDVSAEENMKNKRVQKNNTSGHRGITKRGGHIVAYLWVGKNVKSKHFRMWGDEERAVAQAIAWRDEQYRVNGYHENHGRQI